MNDHILVISSLLIVTLNLTIIAMIVITNTYATTLSKENPPEIGQNNIQNLSTDELDIDVAVDPSELLPPNGTQQISTEGATDIDVNSFPPAGVTIIIENDTVHVTNRPVTIG